MKIMRSPVSPWHPAESCHVPMRLYHPWDDYAWPQLKNSAAKRRISNRQSERNDCRFFQLKFAILVIPVEFPVCSRDDLVACSIPIYTSDTTCPVPTRIADTNCERSGRMVIFSLFPFFPNKLHSCRNARLIRLAMP